MTRVKLLLSMAVESNVLGSAQENASVGVKAIVELHVVAVAQTGPKQQAQEVLIIAQKVQEETMFDIFALRQIVKEYATADAVMFVLMFVVITAEAQ